MTLQLIALILLLAGSAFCSGAETALFNLSRGDLHQLTARGSAGRLVAGLMRQPRQVLNVLLLANMIANVGFNAILGILLWGLSDRGWPPWAAWLALAAPPLLVIFFGEIAPKALAFAFSRRLAMVAAPPVALMLRVLRPVLAVLDALFIIPLTRLMTPHATARPDIATDELNALIDISAKQGVISRDANSLLQEIFELQDLRVSAIMVPRVDLIAYDINAPRTGLVTLFKETHLRRIPIYDGDLDHILGVVHAKRVLLSPQTPLNELLVPVIYLPEAANLERALLQLRARGRQMAVVVDEYGGTAGLVTLEDILEEIVGDIPDADGAEAGPAVQTIGPGEYLIDGDLAIHDWCEAFEIDLGDSKITTVGGFVMSILGHVPSVGDEARFRNLRFEVETMRGRRVGRLRLTLAKPPEEGKAR